MHNGRPGLHIQGTKFCLVLNSYINRNFPLVLRFLWCVLLRPGRIDQEIALFIFLLNHRLFFFFAHRIEPSLEFLGLRFADPVSDKYPIYHLNAAKRSNWRLIAYVVEYVPLRLPLDDRFLDCQEKVAPSLETDQFSTRNSGRSELRIAV